nr:uncharacterized protein LOC113403336 [Vanessa tameamea]
MRVRKPSRLHQDLIGIIAKVADITNIKEIEYLFEFGTDDIDCFLGGLHKVIIKGIRDGAKVKINVIIKWHSKPSDRICFRAAYQRECVFYQYIAPKMLELQRSYNIIEGLKLKFPNCIFANMEYDKETIVTNMATEFKLLDRFYKMDFNHSSLVLKNLAKFHGLSFALENLSPKVFESIRDLCSKDVQYGDPDAIPKSLVEYFKESLSVITNIEAKVKLEELSPYILELLNKCAAPVLNYSAICHADCWNNNILFKYQGKRPVDVLFVDYQLVRYASPVTDISYYLYMSADQEILSNHYNQLLDIYYGTLSAVLRQCHLDVEDIYPKRILQKHLIEYSVLGLIEALISMKIITAKTEEALKMTELKYSSDEPYQCESENQAIYVERINEVVNDYFGRGYSIDALLNQ